MQLTAPQLNGAASLGAPFNGSINSIARPATGGWDFRWKEQLINAIVMTAANVSIFYYGLGLPFKLFPWS